MPIDYRRRPSGRSFVRYLEYLARVAPAVWRERKARLARGQDEERGADRARQDVRPDRAVEERQGVGERPERGVGTVRDERAASQRTST